MLENCQSGSEGGARCNSSLRPLSREMLRLGKLIRDLKTTAKKGDEKTNQVRRRESNL